MVSTTLPAWMCDSSDDDQDQVVPATPNRWMEVINEKIDNQTEDFKEKVEEIKDIFYRGHQTLFCVHGVLPHHPQEQERRTCKGDQEPEEEDERDEREDGQDVDVARGFRTLEAQPIRLAPDVKHK